MKLPFWLFVAGAVWAYRAHLRIVEEVRANPNAHVPTGAIGVRG